MIRTLTCLTGTMLVLVLAAAALAQGGPSTRAPGKGVGLGPRFGHGPGRPGMRHSATGRVPQACGLGQALDQLDLTEPQQEKINEVLQQAREQRRESMQQHRRQSRDDRCKPRRQRRTEGRETREEVHRKIREILTDEQVAAFDRATGPAGPFDRLVAAVGELSLTDEQAAAIDAIAADAASDASAEAPRARGKVYRQAGREIIEQLTGEQKQQWRANARRKHQRMVLEIMTETLDLTDQQRGRIEAIQQQAFKEAQDAETPEQARTAFSDARREVVEQVLTDEQRQTLRDRMGEGRGHRSGHGNERGGFGPMGRPHHDGMKACPGMGPWNDDETGPASPLPAVEPVDNDPRDE